MRIDFSDNTILVSGISASWWTGTIDSDSICGNSSAYVTVGGHGFATIRVNIWKALADGQWSSSTVITVYAYRFSSLSSTANDLRAGPDRTTPVNPARQTKVITPVAFHSGLPCPTDVVGTVTVNDDGTFTVA